jgi:bifunctional non-homologous end joining protein LigD
MATEFAPGIKDKRYLGHTEEIPTDVVLTLVRQLHNARRAGKHEDLRIGSPSGLYSWAMPKGLPTEPGQKHLAIQQPIHDYNYKDFEGTIGSGYGSGTVSKLEESPVVIIKNTPDKIQFTRGTSKASPIYTMIKTKNGNFIVTIKEKGQPTIVQTYKKEHFKSMPIEEVADAIERGAQVRPKIDGASVLAYLGKGGIRAFGTRVGVSGERPEYTDVIGGLRGFDVPKELQGKMLRGELYGIRNGKPIHPNELSALLHSNLVNAIDKKQKGNVQLLIAALAENKNGADDWYTGADDIVAKLRHPAIHGMPPVTGESAKRLVDKIRAGKFPLTREGVVWQLPGQRPVKSKVIDDYDVVIRDIFPAETKGEPRAGGFTYSYPGSDKVVGRVGTGFSHEMLKDMLANPQNYIGQTARVHSQEQLGSGALRAPGFLAIKAD